MDAKLAESVDFKGLERCSGKSSEVLMVARGGLIIKP